MKRGTLMIALLSIVTLAAAPPAPVPLQDEPMLAVQYHPEAAPGPHDSFYLFGEFMKMIDGD